MFVILRPGNYAPESAQTNDKTAQIIHEYFEFLRVTNCTILGIALDKLRCLWKIVHLLEKYATTMVTVMSYAHDILIYLTLKNT